jgi:parallel beta-helix repeat protein
LLRHQRLRRSRVVLAAIALGVVAALVVSPTSRAAGPLIVGDPATCTGATYPTIQDAVDAAVSGDTISVCNGTYTEQVTIPAGTNDLMLQAENAMLAVIKAPQPMAAPGAIVHDNGATGVTIKGFTITGPGSTNCLSINYGVLVDSGGSATVSGNHITAIRDTPLGGCQNGIGIWVNGGGSVDAEQNTFDDYQKAAIVVKGTGTDTISGNKITGAGPTAATSQNGIQVSNGASATVTGNTISGNVFTTSPDSDGILVFGPVGTVTVSGNTLDANSFSLDVAGVGQGTTISGNTVSGGIDGIRIDESTGVIVQNNRTTGAAEFGVYATDTTSGNTFTGNAAGGTSGDGNFDCRDESTGSATAGTANTWTTDTGDASSPEGICAPAPIDIVVPPVIVIPPESGPEAAPPAATEAGNDIIASLPDQGLKACDVKVATAGPNNTPIAHAFVRAPTTHGSGRLILKLNPVPQGQRLLANTFGGVPVDVNATCTTTSNTTDHKVKHAHAVLLMERVVTPAGSWLPDLAVLTSKGMEFVQHLRSRMIAVLRIRCDGFTAAWPASPVAPIPLSLARATLLCGQLKRGLVSVQPLLVPHGNGDPIATNNTESGRATNRRVVITLVHRIVKNT